MRDFALKILNAPNIVSSDNRMSRAAAFLFAFTFLHSLPNALLLLGGTRYDESVKHAHKLKLLPLFEVYLAASFVVHGTLAMKSGVPKRRIVLLLTGSIIVGFLLKHLRDFRVGSFRKSTPSHQLDLVLSRRLDKIVYIVGVLAVALHTYKGISPAWLFHLGFRGDEVWWLIRVGRIMTGISTSLYIGATVIH